MHSSKPTPAAAALNAPAGLRHAKLLAWVAEMAALCKPARIHWCDGSDAEYQRLCDELVEAGTASSFTY